MESAPNEIHAGNADYLREHLATQAICPTLLCTGKHDEGGACVQPMGSTGSMAPSIAPDRRRPA